MFVFDIAIAYRSGDDCRLNGLAALDERRRLKLPDGVTLCYPNNHTRDFAATEDLARSQFGFTNKRETRYVYPSMLIPGDIVDHGGDAGYTKWSDDMTDVRALELFMSGVTAAEAKAIE